MAIAVINFLYDQPSDQSWRRDPNQYTPLGRYSALQSAVQAVLAAGNTAIVKRGTPTQPPPTPIAALQLVVDNYRVSAAVDLNTAELLEEVIACM